MKKLYAYHEKSAIGWGLVVYHDHKPGKSIQQQDPERIGPFEVPEEMIDIDGSPNLGMIAKAFPGPKPLTFDRPPVVLNQEEKPAPLDGEIDVPERPSEG